MNACMLQRFYDAEVGIRQRDILADERDRHGGSRVLDAVDHLDPRAVLRRIRDLVELEMLSHHLAEARRLEQQRHLIDGVHIGDRYNGFARHVTEQGDLLFEVGADRHLRAADDRVGLDSDRAQRVYRVLRGLGLGLLAADHRHQRAVDVEDVLAADVVLELPDRLQEREALDVADSAPHLDHHSIGLRVARGTEDLLLDRVGHVRDDLHRGAEVVTAPLACDDLLVDLARGHVGGDGQVLVDEPLVVAEVEVGLRAVVGDEHLAVLVGAHGPRVDVEVWVQLLQGDGETAGLQDVPDGRRTDPLAERGDDTAGHENVLRHRDLQGGFSNLTGSDPRVNISAVLTPPRADVESYALGSALGSSWMTLVSYSPEDLWTDSLG